jgi:hypothetical protein
MDIVLVVLRLLHILAAVAWVGAGLVQVLMIGPATAAAGESGLRFTKALNTVSAYRMVFPVGGGVTVLAGILLYITGSASHFSQTGNIVLGIGALAGIAAAIHGGESVSRGTAELVGLLDKHVPNTGAIPADGLAAVRTAAAGLASHARISFVLMIIALIGMGTARYL